MKTWICVLCLWAAAPWAWGEIYRCDEQGAAPRYQQVPCADGGGETVRLSPPAGSWDGLRAGERQLLEHYRRQDAREARRSKAARQAGVRDEQASGRTCWQKRKSLETVSAKLRRGYKPAQGERLRRRRDQLAEFIRYYCD